MNLAEVLERSAAGHGSRPAMTDLTTGRTLTYAELAAAARTVAAFLRARGVRPGQRIGLRAPNSASHVAAAFGLLGTGACLVPLAPGLTAAETARIVGEIELNGCLEAPDLRPAPDLQPAPDAHDGARLDNGVCAGFAFRWFDRTAPGPAGLAALDPAFVRFTSGTTSESKGVVLSHGATLARVDAADRVLDLGPEDRVLWVLPLAYHFAVTIVGYVRAGAHVGLCGDTLPGAIVDALAGWEATVFYASPLHVERLGNLGRRQRLARLRLAISTSAPLSESAAERFETAFGRPVGQAYGLIEAGLPCINPRTQGEPATSVGRAVPGYEVAILGDDGRAVRSGGPGEVALRGPGLFSAYYSPWRTRESLMRDGWFMTGDRGRLDAGGALTLLGRSTSVIVMGGLKFFPEEIEACIDEVPGVCESRVVGRPHPHLGEVPCAEVVLKDPTAGVDEVREHCRQRLSSYKVPVEFRVVSAIPRTAGGKIVRRSASGPAGRLEASAP